MAYLTHSSFNLLVGHVEIKELDRIEKEFFVADIYDNEYLYYFFNQFELKKLLKSKYLLEDNLHLFYLKKVEERPDTKIYIFNEGGKVKYHLYKDCEALHKDFNIPKEIQDLGDDVITELRDWFKDNGYSIENYENGLFHLETIIMRYNAFFPKKHPEKVKELDKNYQLITVGNSRDYKKVDCKFDYYIFSDSINELIEQRNYLCNKGKTIQRLSKYDFNFKKSDEEIKKIISEKFHSDFIENYGIEKIKLFWADHLKLKNEAFKLILDYFKWNYNFENKQFNEIFLDDFGLQCCKFCFERDKILK